MAGSTSESTKLPEIVLLACILLNSGDRSPLGLIGDILSIEDGEADEESGLIIVGVSPSMS